MGILEGKKALIFGVANNWSIAWGIAQEMKKQGAQVALSFASEALEKRVVPLAQELEADFTFELDVTNDAHFESARKVVEQKWGTFDILVHSIAFADKESLKDSFSKTSREGFRLACDISAFSLIGLSHTFSPIMNEGGSIMTMTYYGSQKVLQNYNVMGVAKAALEASTRYLASDLGAKGLRVNAISAGPIKTLAASGISGFRALLAEAEGKSPLRRNVNINEVGGTAVYLGSDLSSGVTGQTLYVDAGLSIMGGF